MNKNGRLAAVFLLGIRRRFAMARQESRLAGRIRRDFVALGRVGTLLIGLAFLYSVSAHSQTINSPPAADPSPAPSTEGGELQQVTVTDSEGSHWGIRKLLANTTLTFGIDNLLMLVPLTLPTGIKATIPAKQIISNGSSTFPLTRSSEFFSAC